MQLHTGLQPCRGRQSAFHSSTDISEDAFLAVGRVVFSCNVFLMAHVSHYVEQDIQHPLEHKN